MMTSTWLPYIASAAVIYPIISIYFLRYPLKSLILSPIIPQKPINLPSHTKFSPNVAAAVASSQLKVGISAHRGGAAERPENTMAAFQHAVDIGTELLELDVQLTADGQVVVYHDSTVDRLSEDGVTGLVSSFNRDQLPPLRRSGIHLPPPFNPPTATLSWSPSNDDELQAATIPPLLSDVLDKFPTTSMNIDLKSGNEELINKVADMIESRGRGHITIWGSGTGSVSKLMFKRNSNIPMFASSKSLVWIYFKYLTGLLPFTKIHERAIEIPLLTPELQSRMEKFRFSKGKEESKPSISSRLFIYLFHKVSTNSSLLTHLKKRKIKIIYWVLQDDEEFSYAFNFYQADGVMTDHITKLIQWKNNK